MALYEIFNRYDPAREEARAHLSETRAEIIDALVSRRVCDLLVVGGGIHGATFAQLAALNGLRTVLLECNDYASGTSSRSSKMAHGGLRYLELLDLRQVMEGIRAREDLFEVAAHLVKPHEFLIPIGANQNFFKYKLGVGLWFYDLLVRSSSRKHSWIPAAALGESMFSHKSSELLGCYRYTDGILDDSRVVIERILAARQEGAVCLNYARVTSLKVRSQGGVDVGWFDTRTGKTHELYAGIVVNCAGPWVPSVGRVSMGPLRERIRYSQGVHLLFDRPWTGPALFLPLDERSRYYFVWPHPAGTMVGTTEREVDQLEDDPQPLSSEIDQVLGWLEKDLPDSGLKRENLHYAFAGVRTLPLRGKASSTAKLSRRHLWSYQNGMLTLVGGKFTTAAATAYEGLKRVLSLTGANRRISPLQGRKFPGLGLYDDSVEEFRKACSHLSPLLVERAISRFGSRVRLLLEHDGWLEPIGDALLRGEIELAIQTEQALTLEDLMRRRLMLEYQPGNGLELVSEILGLLSKYHEGINLESEQKRYVERIAELKQRMLTR